MAVLTERQVASLFTYVDIALALPRRPDRKFAGGDKVHEIFACGAGISSVNFIGLEPFGVLTFPP